MLPKFPQDVTANTDKSNMKSIAEFTCERGGEYVGEINVIHLMLYAQFILSGQIYQEQYLEVLYKE